MGLHKKAKIICNKLDEYYKKDPGFFKFVAHKYNSYCRNKVHLLAYFRGSIAGEACSAQNPECTWKSNWINAKTQKLREDWSEFSKWCEKCRDALLRGVKMAYPRR